MLTQEQNIVFKSLCDGKSVFLTGSGGSGKTFVVNYWIEQMKPSNVLVINDVSDMTQEEFKKINEDNRSVQLVLVDCHSSFPLLETPLWQNVGIDTHVLNTVYTNA